MAVHVKASGTLANVFNTMQQSTEAALVTTVNRVTRNVYSKSVKLVAKDAGVKQMSIRGSAKKKIAALLKVRKATKNSPVGAVFSTGRRMGLGRMNARWDKRKAGASFINKRGVRTIVPGSFIVNRPGGKLVFKRAKGAPKIIPTRGRYAGTKTKRQPLVKLKGPSIPKIFSRKYIQKEIGLLIEKQWSVEMNRAIGLQLRRKFK